MRLIIAGSRTFNNAAILAEEADTYIYEKVEAGLAFSRPNEITVISGTARGADQLGERWATIRGYDVERYPAQWDVYGKSAGYKRNEYMASIATDLLAFWDGKSRGAKHMIDIAKRAGLAVKIINV